MRRVWLRRAVTSYGECSCLHRLSHYGSAHRRARVPSCVARCLWTQHRTYGLKSSNKLQSKSIQAQKPGESVSAFCEASLGCTRLRSGEETAPVKAAAPAHLSHCHRKSTPPYARAAERAQALDVHCVLDPSNPSNPSDGAPLDQLCPSMRGCLSIRAAVNAHSAATHNKTSNAGTRSAARHQVAGQAQPPAAR